MLRPAYLLAKCPMVIHDDDGDEENVEVPNNLLKGLDDLPSWRDGVSPHSCP